MPALTLGKTPLLRLVCQGYSFKRFISTGVEIGNRSDSPAWQAIRTAKPLSHFLVDSFNRSHDYLRISISERCNLRCLYCMPEEGVPLSPNDRLLSTEEIIYLARIFVSQGVTKIRLTGGEPTVRKDVVDLVTQLGAIPGLKELCMTSNGISLVRKLPAMAAAGLSAVNISLDTLVDGKFTVMTRRKGLSAVLNSIDTAINLGLKTKVNAVVMRNVNDDEILDFVQMAKEMPLEVRFIEYMPFGGNKWENDKMVPYKEMLDQILTKYPQVKELQQRPGDTARTFSGPDFMGSLGFISSMTNHFCGSCTRLRITADGNLKVCLFGEEEVSLRDMIRRGLSEKELLDVIGMAVRNKKKQHAGLDQLKNGHNRPMILIGGLTEDDRSTHIWRLQSPFEARAYSTKANPQDSTACKDSHRDLNPIGPTLTHVRSDGSAHMVDVGGKPDTNRTAAAAGKLLFSTPIAGELIKSNGIKKGDVFSVARIAGIMAVKATPTLIPLCHPLPVSKITVDLDLAPNNLVVNVRCEVSCNGKTGVEMEALVGTLNTLATVYDMCKAVDKKMVITDVKVVEKTGGKSDWKTTD